MNKSNYFHSDIELEIEGKTYFLRPSFQALCEIESATQKSIVTLLINFDKRGIFLKELLAIIKAGIKASGQKIPLKLIEKIQRKGICVILPTACAFLRQGLCV